MESFLHNYGQFWSEILPLSLLIVINENPKSARDKKSREREREPRMNAFPDFLLSWKQTL